MSYRVEYSKAALKQLKKMDRFDVQLIVGWIGKNLEGCDSPQLHGKALTANHQGEWRYRVGNYRILCAIQGDVVLIEVLAVGRKHMIPSETPTDPFYSKENFSHLKRSAKELDAGYGTVHELIDAE